MPECSFLRYQQPPSKHWLVMQNKRRKYSLKIRFNITLQNMLQFQGSFFSSGSEVKFFMNFSLSPCVLNISPISLLVIFPIIFLTNSTTL